MDEIHRTTLHKTRECLVADMDIQSVLDKLIQSEIILDSNVEIIESNSTRHQKVRSLLKILPKRGPNAFSGLVDALMTSGQTHLADILYNKESEIRSQRGLPPPSSYSLSEEISGHSIDEHNVNFGQSETRRPSLPVEAPDGFDQIQDDYDDVYPINSKNPGYVLIINNYKFKNNEQTFRLGSCHDMENLKNLFTDLNYDVECKENLSKESILSFVAMFANDSKLQNASTVIVILMSHGLKGRIYDVDNNLVELMDIFEMFSHKNCPYLKDKPKFFIIQACRGDKKDKGSSQVFGNVSNSKIITDASLTAASGDKFETVMTGLNMSTLVDCVFAYSTFEDYVSFRSEEEGSWFIDALCSVFREYLIEKNKRVSVLKLLTRVNEKVVREYGNVNAYTQMPKPEHYLLKSFYLR